MSSITAKLAGIGAGFAHFSDTIAAQVCEDAIIELDRLQAIVAKLPKCWRLVDGVLVTDCPVVPGMNAWVCGRYNPTPEPVGILSTTLEGEDNDGVEVRDGDGREWFVGYENLYDTKEAAEAAREGDA